MVSKSYFVRFYEVFWVDIGVINIVFYGRGFSVFGWISCFVDYREGGFCVSFRDEELLF